MKLDSARKRALLLALIALIIMVILTPIFPAAMASVWFSAILTLVLFIVIGGLVGWIAEGKWLWIWNLYDE